MEYTILGCEGCPLNSNDTEYGDACRHPSVIKDGLDATLPVDQNNGYRTITPDWCPLKKEKIIIGYANNI